MSLIYGETTRLNGFMFSFGASWVNENSSGLQVAGIYNHVKQDFKSGLQLGMVNNVEEDSVGWQLGYVNITQGTSYGSQIGAVNFTNQLCRGQLGWANISLERSKAEKCEDSLFSGQFGVVNYLSSSSNRHTQIGLFNVASEAANIQFGVVNINTNPESITYGIVNFVVGGYFGLALSGDGLGFTNLTYRMGSKYTYSLLEAGTNQSVNTYAFAWGFRLRFPLLIFIRSMALNVIVMLMNHLNIMILLECCVCFRLFI